VGGADGQGGGCPWGEGCRGIGCLEGEFEGSLSISILQLRSLVLFCMRLLEFGGSAATLLCLQRSYTYT